MLAVLPLSFDYGLSQLTTAFLRGASVVLMNYLFPKDIVAMVASERITGLAAVPPLWIALARLAWPADCTLRFHHQFRRRDAGGDGRALRALLPRTDIFLMYGLTEAFRSTYLPPSEVARRPDSIGRAIPNAEVLVVRPDGSLCAPDEPGELVHRGALVALGYWNDPAAPPSASVRRPARIRRLPLPNGRVVGRYRAPRRRWLPVLRRSQRRHDQGVRATVSARPKSNRCCMPPAWWPRRPPSASSTRSWARRSPWSRWRPSRSAVDAALLAECRRRLPAYMVPAHIELRSDEAAAQPEWQDRPQPAAPHPATSIRSSDS
jgi:acyl-CoA synthetase (AMP-forming)/AMP-acid ligase II